MVLWKGDDFIYESVGVGWKWVCEELLFKTHYEKNFPITILRPFYIYGAKNNLYQENYIFHRLIQKMPIILPGDGLAMVQFGHVYDLANAVFEIMLNEQTFGQAYNVSGSEHVSLIQWVNMCAQVVGVEPRIFCMATKFPVYETTDFFHLADVNMFGSIEKLSRLGVMPEFSLVEGLKQTYEMTPREILYGPPIQTKQEINLSKWKSRGFI